MPARPGVATAALVAGGVVAVLTAALARHAIGTDGLNRWNLPAAEVEFQQAETERADLDALRTYRLHQIAASDDVIGRLVDGRLSLAAAVAELEQINRDRTPFTDGLGQLFPNTPDPRLRLARWVLSRVGNWRAGAPDRLAELLTRLETEYRELATSNS
jgi:hypothetical protein